MTDIKRRDFLLAMGMAPAPLAAAGQIATAGAEMSLHVSESGSDQNPGTQERPLATLSGAQRAVRELKKTIRRPIRVVVHSGTYYLEGPLVFKEEDSGTADALITYAVAPGERVTLSGGRRLNCRWRPYRNGILMCDLPEVKSAKLHFTQLFVNGQRQIRARYPNYDPSTPGKSGYIQAAGAITREAPDPNPGANDDMSFSGGAPRGIVFDPSTFTKKLWAKPNEAVIHIFQAGYWGNLQWCVKSVEYQARRIWFGEGGYQMGAKWDRDPSRVNERSRFFIENVFEELDAPREWYLDSGKGVLYYIPEEKFDPLEAVVEVPLLEQVVQFAATQQAPVHHVVLDGFRISHTASTFLAPYEVPSLSDWAIHRGGAIFMEGAGNCTVKNCWFDAVGGNAVFLNNYNRDSVVTGCKFTETGDSAICFVGDVTKTNGTQRQFPYQCHASNNLIHDCGVYGKQIAGIYISRAKRITAAHNSIYNMPRSGICIGDGTWGGHVIESNYIHHTVRETGDHGPFNSWGRERQWSLAQSHGPYTQRHSLDAWSVLVDAMEPVIVRNNLFEETSGWGLDLDDGASNYEIYQNISIGVSMKLREGAYRKVYNNIWYNSRVAVAIHTGNEQNHDRYFRNITVMAEDDMYSFIAPPARGPWMEELDYNCFFKSGGEFSARVSEEREADGPSREVHRYTLDQWQHLGFDRHSVFGDPSFVDPANKDFRLRPGSPALSLGFESFEMGRWGITVEFPAAWREA
jgi:hypothetical protein